MFYQDVLLIWRYGDNRELQAIITFYNEKKYKEFLKAQNKKYWLQSELDLDEKYFWNTYIDLESAYFQEVDNERRIDRELQNADSFIIK
jgi:hypothetical protein